MPREVQDTHATDATHTGAGAGAGLRLPQQADCWGKAPQSNTTQRSSNLLLGFGPLGMPRARKRPRPAPSSRRPPEPRTAPARKPEADQSLTTAWLSLPG
jgi:hypothetical protein